MICGVVLRGAAAEQMPDRLLVGLRTGRVDARGGAQ